MDDNQVKRKKREQMHEKRQTEIAKNLMHYSEKKIKKK